MLLLKEKASLKTLKRRYKFENSKLVFYTSYCEACVSAGDMCRRRSESKGNILINKLRIKTTNKTQVITGTLRRYIL